MLDFQGFAALLEKPGSLRALHFFSQEFFSQLSIDFFSWELWVFYSLNSEFVVAAIADRNHEIVPHLSRNANFFLPV